jgi:uncharacterized SAM-binding protein YcdF (DUF218 family)
MPRNFRLPSARRGTRGVITVGVPRRVSSWLLIFCLGGLAIAAACAPFLGRLLWREDPLQPADAILVLSGTIAERPLEAFDLYRAHLAPLIVLTREAPDGAQLALARRQVPVMDKTDWARDLFMRLGVPADAILVAEGAHDSTADEGRSFRALIQQRRWHRVIVVTSKMHTRRARMTMTRLWKGLDVEVVMHASRYDDTDPAHWWRRRHDAKVVVIELQKYLMYWVGAMR